LEVEKVGVQGAECGSGEGGGGRIEYPADGGEEENAPYDIAESGRRGGGNAGAPPGIDAGKGDQEDVR
jgi:hypothetical protein